MKQISPYAFIQLCKKEAVQFEEFFGYSIVPKIGDYHFKNGGYASKVLPNQIIDGVYIENGYCYSGIQSSQELTKSTAADFCEKNGGEMPRSLLRDSILSNRKTLNDALKRIGWAELKDGSYWSTYDQDSHSYTIPGCYYPDYFDTYGGGIDISDEYVTDVYYRYVCVVFEVKNPLPNLSDAEVASLLQKPDKIFDTIIRQKELSPQIFQKLYRKELIIPQAGYFINADGKISDQPQGEKSGVFVTKNLYLDLAVPEKSMTFDQAQDFCKINKVKIPTKASLELLLSVIDKVDYALDDCGKKNYRIFDRPFNTCWFQEYHSPFPGEKRRLLVFRPFQGIDESYSLLMKLYHFLK